MEYHCSDEALFEATNAHRHVSEAIPATIPCRDRINGLVGADSRVQPRVEGLEEARSEGSAPRRSGRERNTLVWMDGTLL